MGLEHKLAMLNPTRVNLNGAGGGGKNLLTSETIAGALGNAGEQRGVDLLIADFVGITDYRGLENRLYEPLLFMAFRRGWIPPAPLTLQWLVRRMLRVALYEKLIPERCSGCKGRGKRQKRVPKRQEIDCPDCNGRGTLCLSLAERLEQMRLDLDQWERCWSQRYHDIQAWLDNLTGTAEADFNRALR